MADQDKQHITGATADDIPQDQIPEDVPLPEVSAQAPTMPQAGTPQGQPQQIRSGAPSQAADADLIEKEWVIKAKQIVEHTKDNPYEQQKALGKFKADYMKKRYNKDIKISDA